MVRWVRALTALVDLVPATRQDGSQTLITRVLVQDAIALWHLGHRESCRYTDISRNSNTLKQWFSPFLMLLGLCTRVWLLIKTPLGQGEWESSLVMATTL